MRPGAAFLIEGTSEQNGNVLANGHQGREGGEAMTLPLAEVGFVEATWVMVVKSIVIFLLVFMIVPMLTVAERKLIGRFQNRYGPNRVGPFGLLQPLADIGKLAGKELFRPTGAVPLLFAIAPALVIFSGIVTLAIIPFGNVEDGVGLYGIDVSIGVLYFFAFGSLSFYGLLLAGWSSGSKYSFLGSMRAAAQLISYEVSMGLALLGAVMMAGSLSLTSIVDAQDEIWYIVPQIVGFLIFMVAGFAETNRAPFDLPEADAELVQGYMTEYGGMRFGSYLLAEYLEMFVVSAIAVTFFLGGWMGPGPGWLDPVWLIVQDAGADLLLHLGPRDAAAPALRPADEPRLEDHAAAGDPERPRHRGPGDGALMEAKLNTEQGRLGAVPLPRLGRRDLGPARARARRRRRRRSHLRRHAEGAAHDLRPHHRGPDHDPVPRGEDAGLSALPRPPQAPPLRGHRAREVRRLLALRSRLPGRLHPRRRRTRTTPPTASRAGERYAEVYEINLSRCIFCGYCEVACPFDAITMGHDYEMSDYNRADLIFTKEMLLAEPIDRTPLRREGE